MGRPKTKRAELAQRKALGSRLREAREEAQLSQSKMAALLDVEKIHVQRFENGLRVVPLALLPKLCEVLGKTASQILNDDRGLITRAL